MIRNDFNRGFTNIVKYVDSFYIQKQVKKEQKKNNN